MTEDLARLAADIDREASKGEREAKRETETAARRTRDAARSQAPRDSGDYADSITYDLADRGHTFEAHIGPDKDLPHGWLGHFLEFGTASAAPRPHLQPAFDAETPRYLAAMGAAAAVDI